MTANACDFCVHVAHFSWSLRRDFLLTLHGNQRKKPRRANTISVRFLFCTLKIFWEIIVSSFVRIGYVSCCSLIHSRWFEKEKRNRTQYSRSKVFGCRSTCYAVMNSCKNMHAHAIEIFSLHRFGFSTDDERKCIWISPCDFQACDSHRFAFLMSSMVRFPNISNTKIEKQRRLS